VNAEMAMMRSDLHDRLLRRLIINNLPQPEVPIWNKIYYREVPVGYKAYLEWIRALTEREGMPNDEMNWINTINTCPISRFSMKPPPAVRSSLKVIDYVCVVMHSREKTAWVIEGKKKLNYEAVGQVNVLSYLFSRDCPQFPTRKAIVCEESDTLIEEYCKKFDIAVFCLP